MIRTPMRPVALAALLALACSRAPSLDEARAAPLAAIVADVDESRLVATVGEFVQAHETDTPMPCSQEHRDTTDPVLQRFCHLTRDKARELLLRRFEDLGLTVQELPAGEGDFATVNLVAEKRGTTRPDEIVLVGAHFDAFYSGADDNSSGVAAMLEIARVLSGRSFPRTLRFVGFDLEELGLVGSTRYVTAKAGGDDIVGAIVFDCVGYRSREPGSQKGLPGFAVPDTGDFIAVIGDALSAGLADDVWLINAKHSIGLLAGVDSPGRSDSMLTGNLMRSDHAPFWLNDKPALFVTDTANFRNPHYHTATDVPDTLDPEFLTQVVKLSAASIAYWAGGAK